MSIPDLFDREINHQFRKGRWIDRFLPQVSRLIAIQKRSVQSFFNLNWIFIKHWTDLLDGQTI